MPLSSPTPHLGRAILAILAAVAALALGDAMIKASSLSLPVWQMFVLRSALILPVLWWLAQRNRQPPVRLSIWIVIRSTLLVLTWISYYAALPLMPLTLAAAAYYTAPLFIVILTALIDV